ncbi:MAG: hypothetical protein RL732_666, partial [Bacteroidota bacterium]
GVTDTGRTPRPGINGVPGNGAIRGADIIGVLGNGEGEGDPLISKPLR